MTICNLKVNSWLLLNKITLCIVYGHYFKILMSLMSNFCSKRGFRFEAEKRLRVTFVDYLSYNCVIKNNSLQQRKTCITYIYIPGQYSPLNIIYTHFFSSYIFFWCEWNFYEKWSSQKNGREERSLRILNYYGSSSIFRMQWWWITNH